MIKKIIRFIYLTTKKSIVFINFIAAFALLSAWIGSQAFFENPFLSIMALGFPLLFIINLIFIGFWLFFAKTKSFILVSLIPILISLTIVHRFWSFNQPNQPKDITIMDYNIKSFTPYKEIYYDEDVFLSTNQNIELIKDKSPDILCLQEYDKRGNELKTIYPYHIIQDSLPNRYKRTVAIFSKYPIKNSYSLTQMDGLYTNNIVADIEIQSKMIRVYACHFESLTLSKELIKEIKESKTYKKETLDIFNRFTIGFTLHYNQINTIFSDIEKSPYPVLLCGDFNNSPFSYEYAKVLPLLNDAYTEKGSGWSQTYHIIPIPLRIDYIFIDKKLPINSFQIIPSKISDHQAVISSFSLN